ncbi:hypothetical protein [Pseudooceanicola sp. LIPI14-2-Ac024]|uniref:hypothetical protein n=1 Tax=Pseudooceanicola sp. LIPI14-2-Ac024 TaxID=3344875 RepID=UPI0035CF7E83
MAEHHYHETRTTEGRSTGTIAFIVGGLVVAVGLVFYFLFGGADMATTGAPNVEINATADSAAGAASDDAAATDGADAGAAATADTSGADAGAAATASD